ncbi:hypothetical protein EV2_029497 [Malus domestica]
MRKGRAGGLRLVLQEAKSQPVGMYYFNFIFSSGWNDTCAHACRRDGLCLAILAWTKTSSHQSPIMITSSKDPRSSLSFLIIL